jgi:signal transduction histidine kinase
VEEIRRQVATIETTDLSARVPVPVTHDEVQRLADTMNQMLARLEQGQLRQRRFVADASHELRSPLTTLSASLELAALGDHDPKSHAVMQAEVARMRRLVDDLLLLARADHDELLAPHDDVDLDDVVRSESARLRASALPREVDVQAEIHPVRVHGDADRLGQLVRNLLENAAQATASTVRVTLTSSGTEALLVVEDDGPGIPPEDRARVFDRFVRLDPGRSRHRGGSGLGLAIVREIARSHQATIVVAHSSLGGARFELRMPCEEVEPLTGEADEPQLLEEASAPPSGSSR